MKPVDSRQFERIAKALADPRRFQILEAITQAGQLSCGGIAERFPVGQSTVSHHLKLLADAGLVEVRRQGQHAYFSARPDVLRAYIKELRRRIGKRRRAETPGEAASREGKAETEEGSP
ncbi:MAG: metalloregulator ArsR/SmtB family transcription factor [Bryobacteraceae bacterium]|jgi:ArsR family transcriptional regulator|nr:metalloregulator ArsR/SmtB family transcription factor [Bryobacteraceae bacterium]